MGNELETIKEQVKQLERRCDKKEEKIDQLMEFKNTLLGYAIAIASIVSLVVTYITQK